MCGRGHELVFRYRIEDTSFLFPTYSGCASFFPSRRRALCFGWTASWVCPLGFLCRLTATWLACLAVNPSFTVVPAEPLFETVTCHYFFFELPQFFAPTFLHLTKAPDA